MKNLGNGASASVPAAAELDAVFGALSDATRRAMLALLADGEKSVAQLAAPFSMTQPAISKHLKVLEAAGLVVCDRDAQRRPRRLNARAMTGAEEWLSDFSHATRTAVKQADEPSDEPRSKKKKGKKNKHKKH